MFQTQPLLIYKLILLHLAFAVCSNPKHPSLDILLFVMGFTCPFAIYLFCTVALAAWSLIFADGNSYFDTVGQQFHLISANKQEGSGVPTDLFRLVVVWLGGAATLSAATATSVVDSLLASKLEISGLSIVSQGDSSDVIVRPLPRLKIAARIKATYDKKTRLILLLFSGVILY